MYRVARRFLATEIVATLHKKRVVASLLDLRHTSRPLQMAEPKVLFCLFARFEGKMGFGSLRVGSSNISASTSRFS
jgi:hypothetical protein